MKPQGTGPEEVPACQPVPCVTSEDNETQPYEEEEGKHRSGESMSSLPFKSFTAAPITGSSESVEAAEIQRVKQCQDNSGGQRAVGDAWEVDCNTCRCTETGVACTRKLCNTTMGGPQCRDKDGVNRTVGEVWNDGCNTCKCNQGGIPGCTKKICPDESSYSENKEDVQIRDESDADQCICPERECPQDLGKPLSALEGYDNPAKVPKQQIQDAHQGNGESTGNLWVNSGLNISSTLASVQSKIEDLHGQEISTFNQMRSQIDDELRKHSQDVVHRLDNQKLVITSLIQDNGHMKSIQDKLINKVKEMKDTLVTRSMYDTCLSEKENLVKSVGDITPMMRKLKTIFVNFQNGGMSSLISSRSNTLLKLQQEYKKREAIEKELAEQKNGVDILSANVKNFLKNFEKLLQNYFGVKMNLTKIIENKNSNFAQLSDGLGVVHAKVKEVSDTFAQKIEAEEEKVL